MVDFRCEGYFWGCIILFFGVIVGEIVIYRFLRFLEEICFLRR